MKCGRCGGYASKESGYCPRCGHNLSLSASSDSFAGTGRVNKTTVALVAFAAILAAVAGGVGVYLILELSERQPYGPPIDDNPESYFSHGNITIQINNTRSSPIPCQIRIDGGTKWSGEIPPNSSITEITLPVAWHSLFCQFTVSLYYDQTEHLRFVFLSIDSSRVTVRYVVT